MRAVHSCNNWFLLLFLWSEGIYSTAFPFTNRASVIIQILLELDFIKHQRDVNHDQKGCRMQYLSAAAQGQALNHKSKVKSCVHDK